MRKILTSTLLLAAGMLTIASCSSSDDVDGTQPTAQGQQYITVNIQSVGTTPGSRAGDHDANSGEGKGDANSNDYQDGTDEESKINTVRFYFFGANGEAVNVSNGRNYIDWSNVTSTTGDKSQTVEKVTTAYLVLNNYGGTLPTQMTAVVNPSALNTALGVESMTLDQLKAATTTSYGTTGNFAMTASVYNQNNQNGVQNVIAASTDGKIKSTETDATNDPVDIYVERVAARVQVKYSATGWTNYTKQNESDLQHVAFPLKDKPGEDGKDLKDGDDQYYAVVYGWGLADEQANAYDIKNLATSYNNLGINNWYTADFHRSFWETIPTYSRVSHSWSDYTGVTLDNNGNIVTKATATNAKHMANSSADLSTNNYTYTLPNTPTAATNEEDANRSGSPTDRTKIVIAAKIVKKTGDNAYEPVTIVKVGPATYASLNDAKTAIANNSNLYKVTTTTTTTDEGTTTTRHSTKITPDDIDFTFPENTADRNYEGTATLKDQTAQYAIGTSENNTTNVDLSRANGIINSNKAQIYTSGLTYYYTTIRHLGTPESALGYFGVVRNHIYDITVTGLYGFGTPVYNPDEPIVPETVTDQNSYLAARVNVLQWRVVSQSVNIDGSTKQNQSTTTE